MVRRKVVVIDPNRDESITYANQLRIILPSEFTVKEIWPPYRQMTDYRGELESTDIACLVVEQRLKETGFATYTGYELAQFSLWPCGYSLMVVKCRFFRFGPAGNVQLH